MAPSRRQFVLGGGGLMMSGVLPGSLSAAGTALAEVPSATGAGVVLYRPEMEDSRCFAAALEEGGYEAVALEQDVVRQWRRQLEPLLQRTPGPVHGLTDWSDYQLIRGLCAERRLHVRHESVHQGDRALFNWVIA